MAPKIPYPALFVCTDPYRCGRTDAVVLRHIGYNLSQFASQLQSPVRQAVSTALHALQHYHDTRLRVQPTVHVYYAARCSY